MKPHQKNSKNQSNLERRTKMKVPSYTPRNYVLSVYFLCWQKHQTHRSMEQNKEPRDKPLHIWSIDFQQKSQEYTLQKGKSINK